MRQASHTNEPGSLYRHPKHASFALGNEGPGLLMLHGFPGTPAELLPLAQRLAHGRRVRAPLLPGFGAEIASLGRYRWRDWLEAARAGWKELPQGSSLLGYSMGGALAALLAAELRGEEAPAKLVLLAPFWRMNDWRAGLLPLLSPFVKNFAPFAEADFGEASLRAVLSDIAPEADLDDPAVQTRLKRELVLPTRALAELYSLGRLAYRRAGSVNASALALQGRRDRTVLPTDTKRLAARLRGSLYEEVDADHRLLEPGSAALATVTRQVERFLAA